MVKETFGSKRRTKQAARASQSGSQLCAFSRLAHGPLRRLEWLFGAYLKPGC